MTVRRFSVALTKDTHDLLSGHLLRPDGQEDLCLATYAQSTGSRRDTALIREVVLPAHGERTVRGNVTFTGGYVLRAARQAGDQGLGIVLLHSHPKASGWQAMSTPDADAELSYAHLALELTGHPLVGMTLAGSDRGWSARRWPNVEPQDAMSVRVIGPSLDVSFNEAVMPRPARQARQLRTVSSWGGAVQDDVTRLRILVVGAGSVGLDVALRLAATGIREVHVMDPDHVEAHNLDRLVGASPLDAYLSVSKASVATREMLRAATAADPELNGWELDVTSERGQRLALDYDLIFSCVDRPWPRAVLNQIAYSDLIPVIDGGIAIDTFDDGRMRNATWRSHVVQPGRPCLICNGQISPADIARDREGTFNDPEYVAGGNLRADTRQNVAVLSASVSAAMLAIFTSLVASPGGLGAPGPLQYSLANHLHLHRSGESQPHCHLEAREGVGDGRVPLTRQVAKAPFAPTGRERSHRGPALAAKATQRVTRWLEVYARSRLGVQPRVLRDRERSPLPRWLA